MSSANSRPLLEVQDLRVDFMVDGDWVPAVKSIDFSIKRGESLAIVGESGSGKSTVAMSVLGLLATNAQYEGSISLEGQELVGLEYSKIRKIRGEKIGMIFQEPMTALNPAFPIGEQIIETIKSHRDVSREAATERVLELLALVELPDPPKIFNSYPHQLSGGQRQRVMIAQAMSLDPDLLIADEPTTALDVTVQAEILDLMRNLKDSLGSAILLITHDMGVVADLADRVLVMKNGELIEEAPVTKIFNDPQHDYTKLLLASVPHLGAGDEADTHERTDEPALLVEDLVVEYPKMGKVEAFRAIDGISFKVRPGEILGLVGESGSGKTTVGRTLVGLLPVHSGSLVVAGNDMTTVTPKALRELRRNIGIVFQDPGSSLNPRWSVGESIAEPLRVARYGSKEEIDRRVKELLDQVRLPEDYYSRYPHELSGGQRQRIGIARALALKPKLLIADEPTSALDVSVQASVLELLQEIQREQQFACLFISHDLAVVDFLSDRIAVMNTGKIVEQNTNDEILRNPQHEYTKRLLAAVPVPNPQEQRLRREARLRAKL